MTMIAFPIDDLHLSYEQTSKSSVQDWANVVESLRKDAILEVFESFGEYISEPVTSDRITTIYDVPDKSDDIGLPTGKTDDSLLEGLLKFSKYAVSSTAIGSPEKWKQAVIDIAGWFVSNVTAYNQRMLTMCSLTGMQTRWDCSGFTTACLQRYGLLLDTKWPPRSGMYATDATIAKKLSDGGFTKYPFSWETVQPFDIICYDGHVEIYNGVINGRRTSYAWGSYHSSLPCGTAHQKGGYDYMWRCTGGSVSLFNKMTGPDLGQSFNFGTVHANEGNQADVCKACYQAFRDAGCTDAAAKGICANIMEESMMNPRIATWDGSVKTGTFGLGGGLCGFYFRGALPELAKHAWGANGTAKLNALNEQVKNSGLPKPTTPVHPANTKHIMAKFGGFPFSLQQQLAYVVSILNSKKFAFIKSMGNAYDAALAWEKYYERPAKITDRWAKHGNKVLQLLKS